MKLRLEPGTVRFRLHANELPELLEAGFLREELTARGGSFAFVLSVVEEWALDTRHGLELAMSVPRRVVEELASGRTHEVSTTFVLDDTRAVELIVERDLRRSHRRPDR